jgi:hypothetical protein
MAEPRQRQGVSFARKDRIQNLEATDSGDVVQNAMNLKVHLVHSLLHRQDVLSCHLNQAAAMSPERSYGADESRWPKTGTEQSNRVQVLEPLAIGYVCLPARHVLHVLCVDEVNFEATRFQDLMDRNPVHAGRLHRNRMYPALLQPVGQRMQIASESGKAADRVWISISADGDEQLTCTYIDSRRIRMQDRQSVASSFALLGHFAPPIMPVGCPGRGHRANSQSRSSSETDGRHHTSVRNPRPTLIGRASNRAPMSARAVAVIRPAANIIARLAFLYILSGPGQLYAYEG